MTYFPRTVELFPGSHDFSCYRQSFSRRREPFSAAATSSSPAAISLLATTIPLHLADISSIKDCSLATCSGNSCVNERKLLPLPDMDLIYPTRASQLGIIPSLAMRWFLFHWQTEFWHYPRYYDQLNACTRARLCSVSNHTFHHSPQAIRHTVARGMALIFT